MRKLNMLAAAFALAAPLVWGTTLTASPTAQAIALDDSPEMLCLVAGQSLAPWFKAELNRRVHQGVTSRDDFNLMLAWYKAAQNQCVSGLVDRSLANFRAIEFKLAGSMHRASWEDN